APKSGNSGISQIWSKKFTVSLPLQQVHLIGQHSFFIAEERDQNAEPNRRFRHGVGDDEDRENLSIDIFQRMRERDQVDVHRVEDELDAHQDDDNVPARQHANGSDQQQSRAQRQVVKGRNRMHRQTLFFAMITLPTTATSSRMLTSSNGSR